MPTLAPTARTTAASTTSASRLTAWKRPAPRGSRRLMGTGNSPPGRWRPMPARTRPPSGRGEMGRPQRAGAGHFRAGLAPCIAAGLTGPDSKGGGRATVHGCRVFPHPQPLSKRERGDLLYRGLPQGRFLSPSGNIPGPNCIAGESSANHRKARGRRRQGNRILVECHSERGRRI